MRLLALVTDAFAGYGGIARYNADLLAALADGDGKARILALPRIADAGALQVRPNLRQERPRKGRAAYSAHALRAALTFRPDTVYCGHVYHGPLARMVARLSGARLISQLHGTEIWQGLGARHVAPLVRSDRVLCVSRDTRARYHAQAAEAGNAHVLPNTVSAAFTCGNRAAARAGLGLGDAFVLLTVARLDARGGGYKGHERVLRALPGLIAPEGRAITYLIAGTGDDRARLEAIVAELGLGPQVRFLGKVADDDLPDLYRAADLFIMPSTGEGFGIVYLEAMACGTPALGLDCGGVADALVDGDLGHLVPPEADFAAALQEAVSAPPVPRRWLSDRVHTLFGAATFTRRAQDAFAAPLSHQDTE
jgi:phosphatidylinositol alpha-1,6-mannosyltransferase